MKDPFDCILLFLCGLVLWMWILSGPPARAEEVKKTPQDTSIPYCWAKHYGVYLPCMYSQKVRKA